MELRHLRYFIAVAERLNFTEAARRLRVAQPALSRQVRDLEEELGFPLIDRDSRPVRLTEAGAGFLEEAKAILARAEDAVRNARAIARGERGQVRVGYAPTPTIELLPCTLHAFHSEAPDVKVSLHDLSTVEMVAGLVEGGLDLCLMVKPPVRFLGELEFEQLCKYPVCAVLRPGHPLARNKRVPLREIAREPLLAFPRKHYPDYYAAAEEIYRLAGARLEVIEEHESGPGILAAVEVGRGWMFGPSCLAVQIGNRLPVRPLHPAPPPMEVGAAWARDRLTNATARLLAAARAAGAGGGKVNKQMRSLARPGAKRLATRSPESG